MAGFRDRVGGVDLTAIPYPAVTVVVDFGDGSLVVNDGNGAQHGSVVAGLAPGTVRVRGRNIESLQIRLSPVVARAVMGGVAAELRGMVIPLGDLWGRDAERTAQQLRGAASWDDRFAIAEAALARRQAEARAVDPEVAFAWRQIMTSRGRVRVDRLAAEVEWSRKRFWSRFESQIGLAPKRAARLVRFDHAAHRLAAGQNAASVAAESGYFDQSHLNRDVLAFAGATPSSVAIAPWLAVDDIAWAAREPSR
jgi:AraC-like DNA-binding protein